MRRILFAASMLLSIAGGAWVSIANSNSTAGASLSGLEGNVSRGAYLARASGCIACHTDAENGGKPLAGGTALETEFGSFYPPNLTTDTEHGIGNWDIEDFARALRQGRSPTGDPYYPAFPYSFYAGFSDQDIADLWAAFQTVPPVEKASREQELEFPYNLRSGLHLWQAFFFEPERFRSSQEKGDLYNRGAFLVEAAGHCAACHTPRNFLGALKESEQFAGSSDLPGGGTSPAIHAEALKARGWDVDSLAYALNTGVTPEGDVLGSSMGEVIQQGTSFLSERDRRAIATYLLKH